MAKITLSVEVPEALHDQLQKYLDDHPDWDCDRAWTAAMAIFLLQNGDCDRKSARIYLNTLFPGGIKS